jgi:superfamily II DNA or RNA helicase
LLPDLQFHSLLDTSSSDLMADFFVPALAESVQYDRGVGFFSAAWFRLAAVGMMAFAGNGGRARWVTSPILDPTDWEALEAGDRARTDALLYLRLKSQIEDMAKTLAHDTLAGLAWMVADGVLDFRIAVPRAKLDRGDFHDKFGIFTDTQGNQVSFNGSYNDSIQGTRNYESIKVFRSWEPAFAPLVAGDIARFDRLWENQDPNVRIYDIPQAVRADILQLRSGERPYRRPLWVPEVIAEGRPRYAVRPMIPASVCLRDYQEQAIEAWIAAHGHGLLEMATGAGKTITALAAAVRVYQQKRRLALVVAAPYQHLVEQWAELMRLFGFPPVAAYGSRKSWLDDLNNRVLRYSAGDADVVCVVTTYDTFCTEHFQASLRRVSGPVMLVADEAHHLGAERRRGFYPNAIPWRLALSATPERWNDPQGTEALKAYFGKTVFQLTLGDAIERGILTPYDYYPHLVELTAEEMVAYRELSRRIGQLIAQKRDRNDQQLTHLLIQRANILNMAENKVPTLEALLPKASEVTHTLIYCAPGQIDVAMQAVGFARRIRAHRFTAGEDAKTRQELLKRFASGDLQALVAIRCLDEGVDVPSTRTAYLLASSSNPREFIQRRGRVLRQAPGKDHAVLHDLITVPPPPASLDPESLHAERSLLRRELRRFSEFAATARNAASAYAVIWELAKQFDVLDFGQEGDTDAG